LAKDKDTPMFVPDEPSQIPPCRILMKDGKWCVPEEERPPGWREMEQPKPISDPPKSTKLKADYVKSLIRPKPKNPKPKSKGRGLGWAKKTHITAEVILAKQKEGKPMRVIADELGCRISLIANRLREARKDPEFLKKEQAARTCPQCGGKKTARTETCTDCSNVLASNR
jgi:ssDNA-binding Zn-finger/Zn-ribbon topoisomerase 1